VIKKAPRQLAADAGTVFRPWEDERLADLGHDGHRLPWPCLRRLPSTQGPPRHNLISSPSIVAGAQLVSAPRSRSVRAGSDPRPFFARRRFAFGLLRSQRVWRSTSRAHPEHAQCRSPSPTKKKLGRSVLAFRSGPASFRPARRRRCAGTLLVEMPSPPWGDQARGPSTSRFYRGRGMTRLVLKNGGIRPPRCEQREHHGRGRDYRSSSVLAFSHAGQRWVPSTKARRVAGMSATPFRPPLNAAAPRREPGLGRHPSAYVNFWDRALLTRACRGITPRVFGAISRLVSSCPVGRPSSPIRPPGRAGFMK
jgi:hypothetical protein